LEGGAIYALSAPMRAALARDGSATLYFDLMPDAVTSALEAKLRAPRGKQTFSNALRKATRLSPAAIGLLYESAARSGNSLAALDAKAAAAFIKAAPVTITAMASIERAISSAGGIRSDALDTHFMLRDRPGVFAAGEMLDWEAPTGGYLLQACFATGVAAANGALTWLKIKTG
jgi:predicted flavoprotein YhiN